MTEVVSFSNQGGVGIIKTNNPPVNALSQPVRQGLITAIEAAAVRAG